MVTLWIIAAGIFFVWVLIFCYSPTEKALLNPREIYHRVLIDAQAARGQYLRSGFVAATRSLKDRLCYQLRKWHIPHCPLCCAAR